VATHEIAHGLNFRGVAAYGNGIGYLVYNKNNQNIFLPSIFDYYVDDSSGKNVTEYTNGSTDLGTLYTSNNLWFDGENAVAANCDSRVKLYAPSTWQGGSSYVHLDMTTFANTENSLMVPAIGYGSSQHNLGDVTLGVLKDIGWTIVEPLEAPSLISPSGKIQTLNPTFQWNTVSGAENYILTVTNTDTSETVVSKTLAASTYCSSTCSYPLTTSLTNKTNYQFTVAGVDTYGNIGATSSAKAFYVLAYISTAVYPTGTILTTTPDYVWTPVLGATQYKIKIINGTTTNTYTTDSSVCDATYCIYKTGYTITSGNSYTWSVSAYLNSAWQEYSDSMSFSEITAVSGVPNLKGPIGIVNSTQVTISWTEITDATQYQLKMVHGSKTSTSTFTSSCFLGVCRDNEYEMQDGIYQVQVSAYVNNSWSDYSSPVTFIVYASKIGVPTPISPSGTIKSINPTYTWNVVSGASEYILKFIDGTDTGYTIYYNTVETSACGSSTCSSTIDHELTDGKSYKWAVQAEEGSSWGYFSDLMSFKVLTTAVDPPVLVSPSATIDTLTPAYKWNVSSGATSYLLKVTNTDTSTVIVNNQTVTASTYCKDGTCTFTPSSVTLQNKTNYQFSVAAVNSTTQSDYSTPMTFYTSNLLGAPTLVAPTGTITSKTPTYQWNVVSGATGYQLKVTNTDTNSVVLNQTFTTTTSICDTTTCSYIQPTALTGTNYSFTVATKNANGMGDFATPMTFAIGSLPAVPTIVYPVGDISTSSIAFQWKGVTGATSYVFKVTDQDNPASVSNITYTTSCTSGTCSTGTNTFGFGGTHYQIMVASKNAAGQSSFSTPVSFRVLPNLLSTPVLTAPSGTISDELPTFQWNSVSNATGYLLKVYKSGETSPTQTFTTSAADVCSGEGCSYTISTSLPVNSSYYFTVQAYSSSKYSDVSSSMNFTIAIPPSIPTLIGPSGLVTEDAPTLTWNTADNATSYRIQVTNTDTFSIEFDKTVTSDSVCLSDVCTYTLPTNLYHQNYSFTISAINAYYSSDFRTPMTFYYTTHIPPAKPEATSPSGEITADKPTFTWNAADLATGYQIKVTNTDTPTNDITQTVTSSVCTSGTCTWTATKALMGEKYQFTVSATNIYGSSAESDPVKFNYTTHHAPDAPTLTAPTGKIYIEKPTYTWNASDLATSYTLRVTDTDTSVVAFTPVSVSSTYCVSGVCSYTPSITLTGLNYKFEVMASNIYGSSLYSDATTFIIGLHEPPVAPTLISPSGDNYIEHPTFKWNAISNATSYKLKVTNTATSNVEINDQTVYSSSCIGAVCSVTPTTNLTGLNYQFEVKAVNNYGSSDYSDPMVFAMAAHQAPKTAPTLVGPTGETTDETPTFQWNAVDGATNYQLTVTNTDGTTTYLDKNVLSSVCSSGVCSYTTSAPLLGIYYQFKVQARNTYGNGDYSEPMAFTYFIHFPPDVPTAVSPSGEIVVSRPTYTWNAVAGATSYLLKVTDTDTNTITVSDTVSASACSSGVCSDKPAVSLHGKNYEFAVAAKNAYGQSEYSTALTIIQQLPTPPSFKDLPGNIVDSTPTVQWNAVADATSYQFRILDDKENYIVLDETVPAEDCTDGICEFTPDKEMNDGYYYFEVASINGYGQSDYTAVSVSQNMPIAPTPLSPSGTIYDLKPVIKWKASIGATTYKLTITNTDTSVVSTIAVPSTVCKMNLCSYTPTIVWNDGNYEFTLTASSNFANSENPASSTPMEFTYAYHQVPAVPEGISPSGETVYVQKPIYTWKSVLRATGYVLKVTNNDTGVVSVNNVSVATSACKNGTCAFTPSVSLTTMPNGNYSFVVAAKNANGVSGYSEPVTFDYSYQTVPDAPEVISFTDTVYAQKPVYKWNVPAGSAPTGYYFRLTNVDTNKVVSNNVLVSASACKNSICSYTPSVTPTTMPAGNYVFEVSAKNNFGQSDYTASDQFEYLFQTAPNAPDVNSFTDTVYAQKPVYTWNVPSNGSAPTGYYFRLTNVDTNKVVVNNVLVSVSACKNLICSYTPAVTPLTMPAGNYVFEVSAKNNYGQSDYIASDQFEYLFQTAPDAPEVNAFDGTVYVQKPVYTWKMPSSGSAPTGYYFRLTNVDTDKVVINSALVSVSACKNLICSYTPSVTPTTMPAGNYVFEVSAKNNYGQSDYTASDQFEYLFPTAPNAPDLISPTEMSYLARPTYTWNVPSTGSAPTGYLFKLTNLDSGKVVFNGVSVSTSACKNLICTYSPSVTAITMPDGNYEFAVAARNSFGSSDYSTAVSFIKDTSIPPAAPSLIGPTGTTNLETFPFSWYPSEGATGYVLNVTNTDSNQVVVSNLAVASKYCVKGVCSFTPAVNFANGNYKFTVASTNLNGTGSSSDETTFTVFGFNSQFTKNSFGWSLGDYSYWKVSGGSLVTSGSMGKKTIFQPQNYADFDYSARVKRTGGIYQLFAGYNYAPATSLFVRASVGKSTTTGYEFAYYDMTKTGNSYYAIWKHNADGTVTLIQAAETNAITAQNWNTLRVTASGNQFNFYINGQLMYTLNDSDFSSGLVGLSTGYNWSMTTTTMSVDWATLSEYSESDPSGTISPQQSKYNSAANSQQIVSENSLKP